MELTELSNIWTGSDDTMQNTITVNRKLLKEVSMAKIKSTLFEIKWTNYFEIIVSGIFLIFLVQFLFANSSTIEYSISAGTLVVVMLISIVFNSHRLTLYYKIHPDYSVVETQATMEELKRAEIIDRNLLYVIIPLSSLPFLIVLAKAILNINMYQIGYEWLGFYIIGSIAVALAIVFVLKKFPNMQLKRSQQFLNSIREFETT